MILYSRSPKGVNSVYNKTRVGYSNTTVDLGGGCVGADITLGAGALWRGFEDVGSASKKFRWCSANIWRIEGANVGARTKASGRCAFWSLRRHSRRENAVCTSQELFCTAKRLWSTSSFAASASIARSSSMFMAYEPKRLACLWNGSFDWSESQDFTVDSSNQGRDLLSREDESDMHGRQSDDDAAGCVVDNSSDLTVICFDIETTGLSVQNDRIIEFAARDLAGGECSTIETLVNPEMEVKNAHIHNIGSQMVNNPCVPRWKDVAPAILGFVESRRKGRGQVILVAHNGKRFDVPFIMNEFFTCGVSIPSYWRFADSLVLARLAMKGGSVAGRSPIPSAALGQLFTYYNLPSVGKAHRAMADVNMLAHVLQMLMNDLKMSTTELLAQSFGADEVFLKAKGSSVLPFIEGVTDDLEVSIKTVLDNTKFVDNTIDMGPATVPWDLVSDFSSKTVQESCIESSTIQEGSINSKPSDLHGLEVGSEDQLFDPFSSPSLSKPMLRDVLREPETPYKNSTKVEVDTVSVSELQQYLNEKQETQVLNSVMEGGGSCPGGMESTQFVSQVSEVGEEQQGLISEELTIDSNSYTNQVESVGRSYNSTAAVQSDSPNENEASLLTSTINTSLLNPMMRQYVEVKRKRPKFLLLSQVGDFYEAFFEDATRLADACNLRLTAFDGGKSLGRKIPMAGVPFQHIDRNLRILLEKGISVVLQNQVGAEEKGSLMQRQVTAVLTPGTLVDDAMLDESRNNFLVAIMPPSNDNGIWGLAYSDISTGEVWATEVLGKAAFLQELQRLQPAEVIFPANVDELPKVDADSSPPAGLPSQFCYSSWPYLDFTKTVAEKKLLSCCKTESLEAVGLFNSPIAICAAGGLLGYIQETQRLTCEELPLQIPRYYSVNDSMRLDETVQRHLELMTSQSGKLEGSFLWAVDETKTAMGARMLRKWLSSPLLKHKEINERQNAVEIFVRYPEVKSKLQAVLGCLCDLERLTASIRLKRATCRDMLTLSHSLQLLPKVSSLVEDLPSNIYINALLRVPPAAIELANRTQAMLVGNAGSRSQGGELIREGVDAVLDQLIERVCQIDNLLKRYEQQEQSRTGISSLEIGHAKPSRWFISIRKARLKDWSVPKDYQSIQNLKLEERFTTPKLLEYEKVRLEAVTKVAEHEERLLMNLRDTMCSLLGPVREYSKALAELDVLCNFAELALKWGYCRPQIVEDGREITIVKGRHPVVERCLGGDKKFVPNSTYLGFLLENLRQDNGSSSKDHPVPSNYRVHQEMSNVSDGMTYLATCDGETSWPRPDVMILTGPNASGKSCYLRQIGLIQILAQAGSFVPAEKCRVTISDALFTRVGAADDLAAGQSTFKVEMIESAAILENATCRSLVLLDEVGRGTGSREGEAIAQAIIEYLAQHVKARTVFSTHYHDLHVLDAELPNVANYHFEATETPSGEILFDYALRPGYTLLSYAIGMARASGVPDWVCSRASELLSEARVSGALQSSIDSSSNGSMLLAENDSTDSIVIDEDCKVRSVEDQQADSFHLDGISEVENNGVQGRYEGSGDLEASFYQTRALVDLEAYLHQRRAPSDNSGLGEQIMDDTNTNTVEVENSLGSENGSAGGCALLVEEVGFLNVETNSGPVTLSSPIDDFAKEAVVVAGVPPKEELAVYKEEDLSAVWSRVCATLQNQPATQALFKQKGILISISKTADTLCVSMGSSTLFVKKFQQHEHATALEAAFAAVLKRPVKLDISVLNAHVK